MNFNRNAVICFLASLVGNLLTVSDYELYTNDELKEEFDMVFVAGVV